MPFNFMPGGGIQWPGMYGSTPPYFPGAGGPPPIRAPGAGVPASYPAPTRAPNGRLIPTGASAPVGSGPRWLQKINNGFGQFLSGLSGGPNPYLNPQEQAYDQQQRNMAMMGALLGASGPKPAGTQGLLQPFGQAVQAAQQAGGSSFDQLMRYRDQQVRQQQVQQNQRMQQEQSDPAAVREYQFFEKLTPEQKQQYLTVKRNQPGIEVQEIPQADGSSKMVLFNPADGSMYELTPSGVRSAQGVQSGAPSAQLPTGSGMTRTPEAEASAVADATAAATTRREAPAEINSIDDQIAAAEKQLTNFEQGRLQTGFFQGRIPAGFRGVEDEEFQVYSGQQVVDAISSATFGALSEGEREFLQRTVPNPQFSEEANQRIIRERIRILRKAKAIEEGRLEGAGGQVQAPDTDPLGMRR